MTSQEHAQVEQVEPCDGIKENRENPPPAYFNILFYGLIAWAVVFLGYFLLSGWSSQSEFEEKMNTHQETISRGFQVEPLKE